LKLTPDQQTAIRMSCGGTLATLNSPITACAPSNISTTLLRVPAAGTGDPRDNPTRVAPRHIFDLAIGADNLFHTDKHAICLFTKSARAGEPGGAAAPLGRRPPGTHAARVSHADPGA
jgi:hypothetical protein